MMVHNLVCWPRKWQRLRWNTRCNARGFLQRLVRGRSGTRISCFRFVDIGSSGHVNNERSIMSLPDGRDTAGLSVSSAFCLAFLAGGGLEVFGLSGRGLSLDEEGSFVE